MGGKEDGPGEVSAIRLRGDTLRLADVKMKRAKKGEAYDQKLEALQLEMLSIQQAYYHQKRRAIVVFEGWDASGKGGVIRRLTSQLDPRGYRVHPVGAPLPEEQGRHYLYRFWMHLPTPGRLTVFDRSWYGRVLVERVEGLAPEPAWQRAYQEINEFERLLIDDGVRLVKIFLHITADEQRQRFIERLEDPARRWKFTEDDLRNRRRWDDYERAVEDMIERTSTEAVPWHVIPANHKPYARQRVLQVVVDTLKAGVDLAVPDALEALMESAGRELGFKP